MPNPPSPFTLHFLNARGALDLFIEPVRLAAAEVAARAGSVVSLPPMDIVVEAHPGAPSERGVTGSRRHPGVLSLALHPDGAAWSPELERSLKRTLARMIARDLRTEVPRRARTLGDALVGYGLSSRFAHELFGGPPAPWEAVVPASTLQAHLPEVAQQWDALEDNARWFAGKADLPWRFGFTVGYQLIGAHLQAHPQTRASALLNAPTPTFRPALQQMGR